MKGPIQIVYEFRVDWIKKERHEGEGEGGEAKGERRRRIT